MKDCNFCILIQNTTCVKCKKKLCSLNKIEDDVCTIQGHYLTKNGPICPTCTDIKVYDENIHKNN